MPLHDVVCMQGAPEYLEQVLERLQKSQMRSGWENSKVQHGNCADLGYGNRLEEKCFPQTSLYIDDKPEHLGHMMIMDREFVELTVRRHPEFEHSGVE
eukprot:CAMPEP_0179249260 /NCGR_PEP_ID=MMETSP0797-20121207/20554_1 /TAXON_ID=47934 /ORGANISM="Dinophysis acuminata, Strain DAEP01" /LENGTH=97 /DNA_ID=CAMNT_0020956947 /DNA_START=21 /DNA_END=311 /DNA_ORIENTATION=+